jgi:hypothetical protein
MYEVAGWKCTLVYGMGLQPVGVVHNNFAAYTHHLLFSHVRTAAQTTITRVILCHKKVGRSCFNESRVTRLFVLVRNARIYSECYTINKGCNKHVKIIDFSPRIYSTLKFTNVIEYERTPHNDTHTERYEQAATIKREMHSTTLLLITPSTSWLPNSRITNSPRTRHAELQEICGDGG